MAIKNNEDFIIGFDEDFDIGELIFSLLDKINEAEKKEETEKKKEQYQVAVCAFENGNNELYNFRMYNDHEYKVDDIVVVDTQFGMSVARIMNIVPESAVSIKPTKDVVCPVDTKAFYERKKTKRAAKQDETKDRLKNFILAHDIDKGTMEAVINECFKA